jgi:hypothetical protein
MDDAVQKTPVQSERRLMSSAGAANDHALRLQTLRSQSRPGAALDDGAGRAALRGSTFGVLRRPCRQSDRISPALDGGVVQGLRLDEAGPHYDVGARRRTHRGQVFARGYRLHGKLS